ncbi:MAG: hypothetical protein CL574_02930 [Altererythrobacter sp.]|nr:hypothetical protein [Altererythrobacter sp.]|tara:strand:- start:10602 stop:10991 length:390 start_codon:yes stop_codon:yes gene_type:complete
MMKYRNFTRKFFWTKAGGTITLCLFSGLATSVAAQQLPNSPPPPTGAVVDTQAEGFNDVGRTAETGIGEIGRRTTGTINVNPMGRINSRIENRIRNRLRTRIDRNYDPLESITSPFDKADQETRRNVPN